VRGAMASRTISLFTLSPTHPFNLSDGEGGIRTHGTRKGTTVFETARFSHSRTSPHKGLLITHPRELSYRELSYHR
jgi:hypothetical protein